MYDSDHRTTEVVTLDEFDEWKSIQQTDDHLDATELEMLINSDMSSYVLILVNREDHPMGVGIFEYGFVIRRIGSVRYPNEEEGLEGKWHFVRLPSSSFTFPKNPDRWWNSYIEDDVDSSSSSHDEDDDGDDFEVQIMSLNMACVTIASYGQIELVHGETSVIYRSQNVRDDDLDCAMCCDK